MSDKSKAAFEAVSQIKQRFGEGAIMKLGEEKAIQVEAIQIVRATCKERV